MWIKTLKYWFAGKKTLNYQCIISQNIKNQDITRRQNKDKDSIVNKTEYQSKRNPTGNPRGPDKQQKQKHQAPTISSIDKSLSRNRHRV